MAGFELSPGAAVAAFVLGAIAIGLAGTRLAGVADRLADRTGLGEAVTGALLLGFVTALPGVSASVTAALDGYPGLSISNALGGVAVQTAFLAVCDAFYRKTNLEHASASVPNMLQCGIMVVLIGFVLMALSGPALEIFHVHPFTLLLYVVAGFGFWLVRSTRKSPMWKPERTPETIEDTPDPSAERESLPRLLWAAGITSGVVLVSGAIVARSAGRLAETSGISLTVMGGIFMAIATSLPELVTSVAAVRRGALTLAVGDIVGGNIFDVLFVSTADLAYLEGSIYHAGQVGDQEVFLCALTILLNVVLLVGLIFRQQRGPGNIGFESVAILALYLYGVLVLADVM